MHLCCLLKNDMNAKRSNQRKSALYKQALFSFPSLSFFATAVLYLLVFEFSIVIVNCVKELCPFCQLCPPHNALLASYVLGSHHYDNTSCSKIVSISKCQKLFLPLHLTSSWSAQKSFNGYSLGICIKQ